MAEPERRAYSTAARVVENGRTRVHFDCPFCRRPTLGYVWSLAGSGKRCPCGAKHRNGYSLKASDAAQT